VFPIAATVFTIFSYYLFFKQSIGIGYPSDWSAHLFFAIDKENSTGGGYSLMHQLVRLLPDAFQISKGTSYIEFANAAMVIIISLSNFWSTIILRNYFKKFFTELNPILCDFLPIALMMISMLILHPTSSASHYIGSGSPNPWHNPTYIFSKPFALLVFLQTIYLFELQKNKAPYFKSILLLAIFSAISMWAKPSFLLSFIPSVALYTLWGLVRKKLSFRFAVLLALSMSISLLPLYWINRMVYMNSETYNQIIFAFAKVWRIHSINIPHSVLIGSAFPLFVFFIKRRKLSLISQLSIINFILAFLIYLFLAENGDRLYHANFSWTYMFSLFFIFVAAAREFLIEPSKVLIIRLLSWGLFLFHLLSGIYYFVLLLNGYSYQ